MIHVASPFSEGKMEKAKKVMEPAVECTKRVLEACNRAGTVKRVILTSSISAISGLCYFKDTRERVLRCTGVYLEV